MTERRTSDREFTYKRQDSARPKRNLSRHPALPAFLVFFLTVIIWEAVTLIFDIPTYVIPTPHSIALEYVSSYHLIVNHTLVTFTEAFAGFLLGSGIGGLCGLVFAHSRFLERGIFPYVIASNAIPVVAIAPIVILWFGYGIQSKILVAAFLCFFPLCVNMLRGLKSVDSLVLDVFTVYGASGWRKLWYCKFPSAIPYVFAGLKLNATYAVIGAVVSEFVGSSRGLGFAMIQASYVVDTPRLWAAMLMSAALGIAFFASIGLLERTLVPWSLSLKNGNGSNHQ